MKGAVSFFVLLVMLHAFIAGRLVRSVSEQEGSPQGRMEVSSRTTVLDAFILPSTVTVQKGISQDSEGFQVRLEFVNRTKFFLESQLHRTQVFITDLRDISELVPIFIRLLTLRI